MTDERGTIKPDGTIQDRRRSVAYWKQTGVIPRWKLLFVYILILAVVVTGMWSLERATDSNCQRIHNIVSAGDDILDLSTVPAPIRAKWRAADCPVP